MDEIVIYDLEYTTWDGALARNWSKKDEIREITWIAAIRVDVNTLQEIDSFECIIKPTRNPVLSKYFTDLTGLTQERLDDEGIPFTKGLLSFLSFVNLQPIVCHGRDILVLLENFQLKNYIYQAKRIDDDVSIEINLNKDQGDQTDGVPKDRNPLQIDAYNWDLKVVEEKVNKVVCKVDLEHPGQFVSPKTVTSYNIKPWINANAPDTIGKYAGDIATVFGKSIGDGNVHEPLFDVRSILQGVRHLINECGAENIFKEFLYRNNLLIQ